MLCTQHISNLGRVCSCNEGMADTAIRSPGAVLPQCQLYATPPMPALPTSCCCLAAGHFGWDFLKTLQTYPSYNCTTAYSTYTFSNYRGGLSYADLSNRTLYVTGATNSTYGYYPQPCSSGYNWICEVCCVEMQAAGRPVLSVSNCPRAFSTETHVAALLAAGSHVLHTPLVEPRPGSSTVCSTAACHHRHAATCNVADATAVAVTPPQHKRPAA